MRILVFGSRGYLGAQFLGRFPGSVGSGADIADAVAVARDLDQHTPDVVINAAGKTGTPNVDWCEDHKPETIRSNVTGPLILLEECLKRGISLVHVSSGCIYEGDNGGKGFTEDDTPNFFGSFYSRSKAWSDQILREFPVLILRLRMPFDGTGHARSLITKLSRYETVLDVENSVTYLPDFLDAAATLIGQRATGIYNVVNPGGISPFGIMEMYKKIVQPDHVFRALSLKDLPGVVRAGRSNCILSTEKLERAGIRLRPVRDAVEEALRSLVQQGE